MNELKWAVLIESSAELVDELRAGLVEFNISISNIAESIGTAIFVRDKNDKLMGGITGNLWGQCLEIDFLWVHESQRGNCLGSCLLKKMESESRAHGARISFLNTFSFQAPGFYEKHGYQIADVIEGYPNNIKKYFMKKSLP
jgi:N-acetylglutamate synthase-like GNAT family acetyltransferase